MSAIKPGENFYRLYEGKIPEYVPVFDMMPPNVENYIPAAIMSGPSLLGYHGPKGGHDPWGVEYITNAETGFSAIPKTWDYILNDIRDWRSVIKNPDLDAIDWKEMSRKDNELFKAAFKLDRSQTILLMTTEGQFFQNLMAFMGFTEGLCAMSEEPDEVKALNEYMLEFYVKLQHKIIEHYSPDVVYILDDVASQRNPFMSRDMFRELYLPYYKVLVDDAKDHGLPVQFHCCGHCEEFLDDLVEIGVKAWDPAQTMNDLVAVKKRYNNQLAVMGGWDWIPPATWPIVDEQVIRRSVRDAIDKYAPGGGFAMCGGANILGVAGDELPSKIRGWLVDEVMKYGADFYK